ncbi:MAG TPA: 3-keto-5-aminohexanoate cleavage protein [Gemmatimonadales bacterium]|nr:3-keto-5-aminohexanoate cleavage protein [Gemmatimonadales bacterium]
MSVHATPRARLLQAALNGGRRKDDHPAVPTTAPEVADAAAQCVQAGARAIHVHVRDARGLESVAPGDVAHCVAALRAAIPGTPVGVSTGAWIMPEPELRHRTVSAWTVQPDYASVNFHESGAEELATLLLSRGTGIEVGLPEAVAAERLVRSDLAPRCLRVLIEPQAQALDAALRTVEEIEAVLDAGGVALPRLLHGLDHTAWPLIGAAAARGYDTRIGFEDTLTLPDGTPAPSNAALVTAAHGRFA